MNLQLLSLIVHVSVLFSFSVVVHIDFITVIVQSFRFFGTQFAAIVVFIIEVVAIQMLQFSLAPEASTLEAMAAVTLSQVRRGGLQGV